MEKFSDNTKHSIFRVVTIGKRDPKIGIALKFQLEDTKYFFIDDPKKREFSIDFETLLNFQAIFLRMTDDQFEILMANDVKDEALMSLIRSTAEVVGLLPSELVRLRAIFKKLHRNRENLMQFFQESINECSNYLPLLEN